MKKFNSILYETSEHIAEITLNRPDRLNALDKATLIEINDAMDLAEADSNIRVIILLSLRRDLRLFVQSRPKIGAPAKLMTQSKKSLSSI